MASRRKPPKPQTTESSESTETGSAETGASERSDTDDEKPQPKARGRRGAPQAPQASGRWIPTVGVVVNGKTHPPGKPLVDVSDEHLRFLVDKGLVVPEVE